LSALGFARQEALFLQHLGIPDAGDGEADSSRDIETPANAAAVSLTTPTIPAPVGGGQWSAAEERAHEALDRRLEGESTPTAATRNEPELERIQGTELVGVFERLAALGMQPQQAAAAAQRYGAQLRELGDMGFENWIEAVELLQRYGGRLLRVANLLSERAATGGDGLGEEQTFASPAPAPVTVASSREPVTTGAAPLDRDAVQAQFQELVRNGMLPNEAATRAIQMTRAAPATSPASAPVEETDPPPPAAGADEEKLGELASMGFVDEERNRLLLRKYAGRMERVIEALIGS